ncbi:MAG: MFS transporter [Clostridia bacterium]|nr:MFS transporter [Clostridia bacterium]
MSNYQRTKKSCYFAYLAMSSVFSLPPVLFMTFREMYGISYTLLGTLVLVNFCTQLAIDLIFTFFTRYFSVQKTVRVMPLLTALGLLIYALSPKLFPDHVYIGLLLGTVIFSVAAGLCEVLLSPVVAALPSENPERDMSMLHSLYAWGVVSVVLVSTLFLAIFGNHNWMYLTLFLAIFPLVACYLFCTSPIPPMDLGDKPEENHHSHRRWGLALCVGCIFLGSAAENVMTNWISGYMEKALHISKVYGDIFGMAAFAVFLGMGRTIYAKYGKHILKSLMLGMAGAVVCYVIAGISNLGFVALLACVLNGLATSMLWPGTLILMEEKIPHPGVAAYALMAAGGDFGASIAPQLMGIVVDKVSLSNWASQLGNRWMLTTDQIGMKTGMLVAALFPLVGVVLLIVMKNYFAKQKSSQ